MSSSRSSNKPVQTTRRIWRSLNGHERRRALLQLGLSTIQMVLEAVGVGIIIPAVMIMTSDDIGGRFPVVQPFLESIGNPTQTELVIGGMLFLAAFFLIKNIFIGFSQWVLFRYLYAIRVRLSEELYAIYLQQPYSFHIQNNSAYLIRNTQTETNQFVQGGIRPAITIVTECMLMAGVGALLMYIEPVGALTVVGLFGVSSWAFSSLTRNRIIRWGSDRKFHDGQRLKQIQQGLGGVKEIKLLGRELEFVRQYRKHNKRAAYAARKQQTLAAFPRLFLETLAVFGLAMLVAVMVIQGRETASMVATLGVFGAAAFRISPSINKILTSMQSLQFAAVVIDHVSDELRLSVASVTKPQPMKVDPLAREIRIESVSFKYPGEDTIFALNEVSLEIGRGSTVGFVGTSGSGKSTLIDMILGVLEPDSGCIAVDGADIRKNLRGWQDQIGYVPQTIYLSDDSLRRNIALGIPDPQIDDAAVDMAVKAAQLRDFVADLPKGLETTIGERGVQLSGGQRQRIGIARALYGNPGLLVLDEATSALDNETEHDVMETINALHGAKTILIVAHRLTTVERCDRLYKMDRGRISEVISRDVMSAGG